MLQNSAQRVIDGVAYISEAVSSVSLEPSTYISSWVADKVAPKYWEPNSEIKVTYRNIIIYHLYFKNLESSFRNFSTETFHPPHIM